MQTSSAGIRLIKAFEGFRSHPYRDIVGVPTIGYGHIKGVTMDSPGITEREATDLLADDLRRSEASVNRLISLQLKQCEFDALVSFCFNLGGGALQRSTLRQKLNRGDRPGAAVQFLKWCRAGGKKSVGLVRRRQAEMDMFLGN